MKINMLINFLLVLLLVILSNCEDSPVVTTNLGVIKGLNGKIQGGRVFSSFEGIPYAEPPVGERRFKAPQPKNPWIGTWNATRTYFCLQHFFLRTNGEEDCLYLNVYVPRENPTPGENLDVFVFIHGGAFMGGSGHSMGGPEYLMEKDLIYVSLNYRLGPLGFLDTEDDTISANNGLKDQTMALRWVNENIRNFGGNPDSVILAGVSAGAASVHFHYTSPLSKGLFHRAISISGSAFNPWVLQEAAAEKVKRWAALAGCDLGTNKERIECLRQRPAAQIVDNVRYMVTSLNLPFAPFGPTVEKTVEGAFLPDHPETLIENGQINDVPYIFSVTKDEGIFPAAILETRIEDVENEWSTILPNLLDYNFTVEQEKHEDIATQIRNKYLNGEKLTRGNFPKFIELNGDRLFKHGVERAVRLHARNSKQPVYFYVQAFQSQTNIAKLFSRSKENYGVSHGTDLLFLFPLPYLTQKLSDDEVKMKNVYMDLMEHFATSSSPQIQEWLPVENTPSLRYLEIRGPEDLRMVTIDELSPNSFWDELYTPEYRVHRRRIVDEL